VTLEVLHATVGIVGSAPVSVSLPAEVVHVPEPILALLLSGWARVAAFVWGVLWGSFANVLIHRIPRGVGFVRSRSQCPHCGHAIAAYDNIPVVSYLVLRGKCRHCREPVALRYLVVELLGGVLSFATYMKFVHLPLVAGAGPALAAWQLWFAFGLALLVVTYVDLDFWIIPDVIVLPMAVLGLAMGFVAPDVLGVPGWEAAAAAAGGYGLFGAIHLYYRKVRGIDGLGLGDAKLLLMVGASMGLRGLVWTIAAGAIQGLVVSIPLLRAGRQVANTRLDDVHGDDPELGEDDPDRVMGQRVPFGPFLALAALEYILLRDQIAVWTDALLGR
jgi:leader peptidase (prepilin peptidase) / N-methyltransferase